MCLISVYAYYGMQMHTYYYVKAHTQHAHTHIVSYT